MDMSSAQTSEIPRATQVERWQIVLVPLTEMPSAPLSLRGIQRIDCAKLMTL